MSLKAFRTTSLTDRSVSTFQDNVIAFLAQIMSVEVLDGVVIEDVALAIGTTTVNHKLGRAPTRMVVTGQSAASSIWWSRTASATPQQTAIIHSTAAITADLFFFGG